MPSKYGNQKIHAFGTTFDSKKELGRYQELLWLEKAGKVSNILRQQPYVLIPAQRDENGKIIERAVSYVADFVYTDEYGKTVVEDAKGFRTKEYILKRKLMLYVHGIRIREV